MTARSSIAFAADLPLAEAVSVYSAIAAHIGVVKVGLSLFVEHGPAAVEAFRARGATVFLDLKLHDIPNTVGLAAEKAGALGATYLTVHASGGAAMLRAAVEGANKGAARAGHAPPTVLAVTVLTSMDDAGLRVVGVEATAAVQVSRLAALAKSSGVGGLVCSAQEVAAVRATVGRELVLCTPGIRPVGADVNDQARVATPSSAIRSGASLLVVGRPISDAADRTAAAAAIEREVAEALK